MTDGADPVLAVWRHAPTRADRVPVLPDGCRDLILHRDPQGRRRCFVSPLTDGPTPVASQPGERYWGFRLRPGIGLEARLPVADGWPAGLTDGDADDSAGEDDGRREAAIRDWLADRCRRGAAREQALSEALACLAVAATVTAAAAALGVTPRTLERLVGPATGRSPGFWRRLARARQAARALAGPLPLADLAAMHGYADQAHMSRDLRAWFGASPAALRRDAALQAVLRASGYG